MIDIETLAHRVGELERRLRRWQLGGIVGIAVVGGAVAAACHRAEAPAPPITSLELKRPGSDHGVTIDTEGIKIVSGPGESRSLELSAAGVKLAGAMDVREGGTGTGVVTLKPGYVLVGGDGTSKVTGGGFDLENSDGKHRLEARTDADQVRLHFSAEAMTTTLDLAATDHGIAAMLAHTSVTPTSAGTNVNLGVGRTSAGLAVSDNGATKSIQVGK